MKAGRALLIALSLAVSFLLLEGVGRLYFALVPQTAQIDEWVFLRSRPAPYADSEYWSEEFVDESRRALEQVPERSGLLRDHEGRWVNIRNGRRHTTDQPEAYDRRLLVFGASTVFCRRVPDALTIPSHLQRLVNRRPGRIRVENHGHPGFILAHELTRLERTPIDPGDIVTFYDGIAEVKVRLYAKRHGTGGRSDDEKEEEGALRQLNWAQRFAYELRMAANWSAAARMVFGLQRNPNPVETETPRQLDRMFRRVKQVFLDDLVAAHRLVTDRGGGFFHFLQPNLYVHKKRSEYEQWIAENDSKGMPGLEAAHAVGYPKLRAAVIEARAVGVASYDITDAFDARPPGTEIYFDGAHVNEVANALAAQRIYDVIFGDDVEPGAGSLEARR